MMCSLSIISASAETFWLVFSPLTFMLELAVMNPLESAMSSRTAEGWDCRWSAAVEAPK
jgi:hypothetical protein